MTASWAKLVNLLAVFSAIAAMIGAQEFHEADLKAVFLLRFGSFMQWPSPTGGAVQRDFVIGVLGEDPILPVLERVVAGETVEGRPVRVVRFHGVYEVQDCEILFVSRSRNDRFRHVLNRLRGRSILTVSDSEAFIEAGGMVSLQPDEGRIRLRVNVSAVRGANITISSKLLRVAEIVGDLPARPSKDA